MALFNTKLKTELIFFIQSVKDSDPFDKVVIAQCDYLLKELN
jgi:hypothetical protein